MLRAWDAGGRQRHTRLLRQLGRADPALYDDPCAALLFSRITTAMKSCLVLGSSVVDHICAIRLFLAQAERSATFLPQFEENGGIRSLVRVLVEARTSEAALYESALSALELMLHITSCGRHGGTVLCDADVLPAVVKLMLGTEDQPVHERCCDLMVSPHLLPSPSPLRPPPLRQWP